jgi:tellurite resistance protein
MLRAIVDAAIEQLCTAFERGGYNPTPILDLGVLVASADGTVDADERDVLLDMFQTLLETSLTAGQVDHLIRASLEVIQLAGTDARIRLVGAILNDCAAAEQGIEVALAVAFASEGLSAAERAVIDRLADAAFVSRERVSAIAAELAKHADDGPTSVRNVLKGA